MQPEKALPDKENNFSEWYSEILERAELTDIRYNVKGFIVYRPNLMILINLIKNELESRLVEKGHRQVLFPVVIPKSYLEKEQQHITGFDAQVFELSVEEGEEKLALRPTSETAFYPMYSLWIQSYKDLPLKLFQTVTVYRKETKATRPLIRGREFFWIEAHDAFENMDLALGQVFEDVEITKGALRKFGLAFIVVEREEWDKFPGAEKTFAFDSLMPDGRVLQIATTHYLGMKFSKPFEIIYLNKMGNREYVHQTSFGPGISRMAAAIISVHGDEFGLVFPFEVAPIQVVIVPIPKGNNKKEVLEKTSEIGMKLNKINIRFQIDLSEDRPGSKFYKWELVGVPVRIELGEKEIGEKTLTLFRRDTRKRWKIAEVDLEKEMLSLREVILDNLLRKATERLENSIVKVNNKEEVLNISKQEKILVMNFCGRLECAQQLKDETRGYEIRGRRVDIEEETWGPCALCGEKSKKVVVAARAF